MKVNAVSALLFLVASFSSLQAQSSNEAGLNLITQLSITPKEDIDCQTIGEQLKELEHLDLSKDLRSYAEKVYSSHCGTAIPLNFHAFNHEVSPHEGEEEPEEPTIEENDSGLVGETVWDFEPLCEQSRQLLRCRFNAETGRGFFIWKERRWSPYPINYLVCAHKAEESSGGFLGFFAAEYAIKSRCIVSNLGWVSYMSLDEDASMRNDVHGLLTWHQQKPRGQPIVLPRALEHLCREVFSDAIYCTPTLIVWPTEEPDHVGICALDTRRSQQNLLFIQIANASSRWNCSIRDLTQVDPEKHILSIAERSCVPDWRGRVERRCDLPYIPRSMHMHRAPEGRP